LLVAVEVVEHDMLVVVLSQPLVLEHQDKAITVEMESLAVHPTGALVVEVEVEVLVTPQIQLLWVETVARESSSFNTR
jgi:hypothetical protein